jgi:hypothetical protein
MMPGVFRFLSMRSIPARHADPERNAEDFLNFFFYHVPPLNAALWQSRSEPVKGVR